MNLKWWYHQLRGSCGKMRRRRRSIIFALAVVITIECMSLFLTGNDGRVCLAHAHRPEVPVKQRNSSCSKLLRWRPPLAFNYVAHSSRSLFGPPAGAVESASFTFVRDAPILRTPKTRCTQTHASVCAGAPSRPPFRAEVRRDFWLPSISFSPTDQTRAEGRVRLFAASGNALRIPLVTQQIKKRAQLEKEAAKASEGVRKETALQDRESAEERRKRLREWRVVLHNDDIHTFEFVENAIIEILPQTTRARAYDIALHAHTNKQATILLTWEENARDVALALQKEGLTVSIFPNKIFKEEV